MIDVINYSLGFLFVLVGFLIDINPNLIAGYNTMSKDEKENFDIKEFKRVLKRALIVSGFFIIIGNLIFHLLSSDVGKIAVSILSGLILPLYSIHKSNYYYRVKPAKSKSIYLSTVFSCIFLIAIIVFFNYASKEPQISTSNGKIQISGLYGFDILSNDIDSVAITDILPKILLRTNGLGLGGIKKGYFELENHGVCKLFLQVNDAPYLKIVYSSNKLIYLNFKDKHKTIQLYNELLNVSNTIHSEK